MAESVVRCLFQVPLVFVCSVWRLCQSVALNFVNVALLFVEY